MSKNTTLLAAEIVARLDGSAHESPTNRADLVQRLIEDALRPVGPAPTVTICAWCDRDKSASRAVGALGYAVSHGMCDRHQKEFVERSERPRWRPIATAPRDGTYVLLAGPSGYVTTPLRVEVCKHDAEYRPLNPWVTHSGDHFTDGGAEPTHWMPLPEAPAA